MSRAKETFQKEKQAYWQMRTALLKQYPHKWVAIAGEEVAAIGDSADEVMALAYRRTKAKALYINKVGEEQTALRKKIRRAEIARYSDDYDPPMPMVTTETANPENTQRLRLSFILDTGADVSVLQEDTCAGLGLIDFPVAEAEISGVGEAWETKTLYGATVRLSRRRVPLIVDCRDDVRENILGRNVLNRFSITFDGKRQRVMFND